MKHLFELNGIKFTYCYLCYANKDNLNDDCIYGNFYHEINELPRHKKPICTKCGLTIKTAAVKPALMSETNKYMYYKRLKLVHGPFGSWYRELDIDPDLDLLMGCKYSDEDMLVKEIL